MAKKRAQQQIPAGPHSLALRLDVMGITAYMTKPAIEELISQLKRISEAAPEELYDVHIAMHFGGWSGEGDYIPPSFGHHDGLGPVVKKLRNENNQLKAGMSQQEIEIGITPDEAYRPFDITIMHVTPEVVQKVTAQNNELDF